MYCYFRKVCCLYNNRNCAYFINKYTYRVQWKTTLLECHILLTYCLPLFNPPEIFVHPMSLNATLGTTATFICSANGSAYVIWEVNGTDVNDPSLRNRGIEDFSSSDESGTVNLTLLVTVNAENRGAMIQCVAGVPIVRSMTAILRIQGMKL